MITTILQNGGTVIAEVKIGDSHWVAALFHDDKYVTWKVDVPNNVGKQAAYFGHYFDTKEEALSDLGTRTFEELMVPEFEEKHTKMCHEYWDRGLDCRCVPDWVNDAIRDGADPSEVM